MANPIFITDDDGHPRALGNNPPAAGLTKAWPVFGDVPATPMVARSEWPQYCTQDWDDPFILRVHDQDGIGECNACAAASALEDCRKMQGLDGPPLSPADLYDRINGGRDDGSLLEDAMHELLTRGVGTLATSGELWSRHMTRAGAAERALYGVTEAWLCPEFDHCMSAVIAGFRIVSGVPWYSNYTPDADGWLPNRGRGTSGGHAVKGYAPKTRTVGGTVQYGIAHVNSWGAWGYLKKGYCVFPESMYDSSIGGWWAIRTATDAGGVIPTPKR